MVSLKKHCHSQLHTKSTVTRDSQLFLLDSTCTLSFALPLSLRESFTVVNHRKRGKLSKQFEFRVPTPTLSKFNFDASLQSTLSSNIHAQRPRTLIRRRPRTSESTSSQKWRIIGSTELGKR